jgi:RNA polymerase sigma factor (sigma-70 family)
MPSQISAVLRYLCLVAGTKGATNRGDAWLLQQFVAQRDEEAFAAILERHGPLVWSVCRRVLHEPADAEDAFQATFLVLARKAASIRRRDALAAWLHRVAVNIARSANTSREQRRAHEKQAGLMSERARVDELELRDGQPLLHEEVARLPQKYRVPIVLCYFEGKTHDDAARELGWPLGTVKGRLARARDLLRCRLARRGLALSGGAVATMLSQADVTAAVPGALLRATLRAAILFAARQTLSAGFSAKALALTNAALKTRALTKLALVALFCLLVGAAGGGFFALRPRGREATKGPAKPEVVQPHTDLDGDPLPPGALARLGTVRFRHGKGIWAVAFSPDGKTIASAGKGGSIAVHDTATGKLLRSFEGEEAGGTNAVPLAFAPDGKTLAGSVGRRLDSVGVWEVATGNRVRQFRGTGQPIFYVAFSNDGRTLAGGQEHLVQVWDIRAGKEVGRIPPPPGTFFHGVTLAPDGKTLLTGVSDKEEIVSFCLWERAGGRLLHRWQAYPDQEGIHALALSPDGKRLACALGYGSGVRDPFRLRVWAVPSGELQLDLPGNFHSLRFSPDGKVLAAGATGSVSLVALDTGKEIRRIPTGWMPSGPMDSRPDGQVLALGALWTLTLWDVTSGDRIGPPLDGHERVVEGVTFLPDGKTLASQSEDDVHFWDARTGRRLSRFVGAEANFNHQALSPDGKTRAVAGWGKTAVMSVGLWDTGTGKKRCDLEAPPTSWPRDLVFSPDGKMLGAASWDDTVRLWDAATGRSLRQVAVPGAPAQCLAFSPDGTALAVGEADERRPPRADGVLDPPGVPKVRLVDVVTGRELRKPFDLAGSAGEGFATPLPDGKVMTAPRSVSVGRVAFSADGKLLAAAATSGGSSSSDNTIQVWEVETGRVLCRLEGLPRTCRFALSPDGKSLLTPGDPPLLWEVATGKVRARVRGHAAWAEAVAFSPDGSLLATGSRDTTALVWDALNPGGEPPAAADLSPRELEALWADLAGEDAPRAYRAIRVLVAAPGQAIPFLRKRLRPAAAPDPKQLARLIADLDDDEQFAVREKATRELEKLGRLARPALQQVLAGSPSPEVRRRVERALQRGEELVLSPEELRGWRAVEVLEHIGTADARDVLDRLGRQGPDTSLLCRDARAALERLRRRPAAP